MREWFNDILNSFVFAVVLAGLAGLCSIGLAWLIKTTPIMVTLFIVLVTLAMLMELRSYRRVKKLEKDESQKD